VFINYYQNDSYLGYVPVDAGSYTMEVIVCQTANYKETHRKYAFTISRAVGGIKVNNTEDAAYDFTKVFDDSALTISPKSSGLYTTIIYEAVGLGKVSYAFYNADGEEISSIVDAGTYYVQFFVEEYGNYDAFTSRKYSIEVLKKYVFFGDINREFSKNYDGTPFVVDADVFKILEAKVVKEWIGEGAYAFYNVIGVTIEEATSDLRIVGKISTVSDKHGTYINSNHFDTSALRIYDAQGRDITKNYQIEAFMNVTIKPAKIVVTCNDYVTEYTGQSFTINPRPIFPDDEEETYHILYSEDGENYQFSPVRYKDCGTYEIFYKVVFENYEEVEGSGTITITPIEASEIKVTGSLTKEYDGLAALAPSYSTNTNGVPTYTWFKQNENGDYEAVDAAIEMGHYKVRIDVAAGKNYLETSAEFEFDITVGNITIAWTNNVFYYNGSKQVPKPYLTIAVKGGLDIKVSITGDDPESIRRGSYTAYASIDNPNYHIVNPTCEYTIDYQVIDIPEAITREYTGRPIAIGFNSSFTPSISSVVDAGTYTVQLTLTDVDNCMWRKEDGTTTTENAELTVVVTAADLSKSTGVAVKEIPAQNYTGLAVKPVPTITFYGITLVEGQDYTIRYKDNRDPSNNATIIVTGCGNFKGEYNITFTIRLTVFGLKETSGYKFLTARSATYLVEEAHKVYNSSTTVVVSEVATETTIQEFLSNLTTLEGQTIVVYDDNYIKVNPSAYSYTYVGTGFRIQLKEGNIVKDTIYVSIRGDVNGDGISDYTDLLELQDYISGYIDLAYEYYQAADLNNDGYVDSSDLVELMTKMY
ncbi:MAG: dockerin type I repeat-containing protein, partial [Anaeroplasmataceae bacterium]|nr:dockerin type I repeat-containing protein [Anaeroplasmataceae bacterium]